MDVSALQSRLAAAVMALRTSNLESVSPEELLAQPVAKLIDELRRRGR